MPVSGGLKAERGSVGRDFGPLLRAPTPGEMGGDGDARGVVKRVAIIAMVGLELADASTAFVSLKYPVL